jgi:hypothetical protein
VAADHLPSRGAHAQRGLADALRHGAESLGGGDDDDREHDDGEGQTARDHRPSIAVRPGQVLERHHEDGEAEEAVDDGRHAGEVADVHRDEPGERGVPGILLEVDRGPDAEREGHDRHDDHQRE